MAHAAPVTAGWRRTILALGALLACLAGWRSVGQMQAERHAVSDPARALHWRPQQPQVLAAMAEQALQRGETKRAAVLARQVLRHEPLSGEAFRILAQSAEGEGQAQSALNLYRIAAQRAPRDLQARAWLAEYYLAQRDYPQALAQLDRVLRLSPERARSLNPVLVKLAAEDQAFAEALADTLGYSPPWRAGMLAALHHRATGNPVASGRVMQALYAKGKLSPEEYAQWLDGLLAQGRWGEALARWVGTLSMQDGPLPLVYNGDFARVPSDVGFDWRQRRVPGVLLEFTQPAGAQALAAHFQFLGRRVPNSGLEHPLVLLPGKYQLLLRMRAHALRSAIGLQWQLVCAGKGGVVLRSDPVDGSFAWQEQRIAFNVPAQGCPGQWLRLVNPVAAGAAQIAAGELWLDHARIVRLPR